MQWKNDKTRYGAVAAALHWLSAAAVFGLFALGLWMTGLTYYDPWYRLGPWWHKSFGVVLFGLTIVRLGWRFASIRPSPLPTHAPWERISAQAVHGLLYLLLFCVMLSGYLISTADGRAVSVFDGFAVPAIVTGIENQEDLAGTVHLWLATTLIGLAVLHLLAALKHHFIDKDRTLARMLGR
ncbi:MAG: cytochrome b [Gammaproteobacteria bacterium]|nr:cytochrome b [Gammaproteobacteria bacterium]